MTMFLKPLVLELNDLQHNGFSFSINGEKITTMVMLLVATMDSQARALVVNMTHHNGMNGCLHCTEHGEVKCGAGWCRIYPARNNLPELRTSESAHLSTLNAAKTGKRVDGFFGKSVLMYLPYFSITDNIVYAWDFARNLQRVPCIMV